MKRSGLFPPFRTKIAAFGGSMNMPSHHGALRVVIVEDNYDANVALSRVLERSGFEVAGRAYDGLSGLSMIKATSPDVAILDIAMPALDGFGLARRLRSEMDSP